MADPFFSLVVMTVFLFLGSMLAGYIPLVFQFSDKKMKLFSLMGVGMLVGTALIVIIPEGIHTMYATTAANAILSGNPRYQVPSHSSVVSTPAGPVNSGERKLFAIPDGSMGTSLRTQKLQATDIQRAVGTSENNAQQTQTRTASVPTVAANSDSDDHGHGHGNGHAPGHDHHDHDHKAHATDAPKPPTIPARAAALPSASSPAAASQVTKAAHSGTPVVYVDNLDDHDHDHGHDESDGSHNHGAEGKATNCDQITADATKYVGAALALGFVFQLIIDRWAGEQGHGHSHGGSDEHDDEASLQRKREWDTSDRTITSQPLTDDRGPSVKRRGEAAGPSGPTPTTSSGVVSIPILPPIASPGGQSLAANGASSPSVPALPSSASADTTCCDHSHDHDHDAKEGIELHDLRGGHSHAHNHSHAHDGPSSDLGANDATSSATIGMLVHAAVDGVALGAAAFSGSSGLEVVVFLAILFHKFPHSFGMSSYLLHAGKPQAYVARQVLIFSSCAPLSAIGTYMMLAQGMFFSTSVEQSLGLLLLFSAGSFLYVATVHVLPDITFGEGRGRRQLEWNGVASLILGIFLPLLFSMDHSHGHGHGHGGHSSTSSDSVGYRSG